MGTHQPSWCSLTQPSPSTSSDNPWKLIFSIIILIDCVSFYTDMYSFYLRFRRRTCFCDSFCLASVFQMSVYLLTYWLLLLLEILAPPTRPIPGLQLTTSSTCTKGDRLSTAVAGVTPTPGSNLPTPAGLPTSSKSVPATPVSTPVTEKQPAGVMSRIFGSSKTSQPAVSDTPAPGLQPVVLSCCDTCMDFVHSLWHAKSCYLLARSLSSK